MAEAKPTASVQGPLQPSLWGKDQLSAYLEQAHRNRLATFANKQERYAQLAAIDACFAEVAKDWRNPANIVPVLLFFRTLGSYRAACEAAMAGAVVETFVMIRAMLEAAGYAAHIHRKPGLDETWLKRHDPDPVVQKAAKAAFRVSEVKTSIKAADLHAAVRFDRLYNEAIDFGAHPNERGITGNMVESAMPTGSRFEHLLLQGDGLSMDYALVSTARAGLCSLEILQTAFGARFELLGTRYRIIHLSRGL